MKRRSPITIIIADDHRIFREGLCKILSVQKDLKVKGCAENGLELIDLVKKRPPHLVLTDIKMPLMDGIEATRWIVGSYPKVQVIALTIYSEKELTDKMFEAGAADFVLKNADTAELCSIIRRVAGRSRTRAILSKKFLRFLRDSFWAGKKKKQLTEKQIEIVKLICTEHTTREISEKLGLSERTVEDHRRNIQKITGARNVVGIVLYAIKNGIVRLDDENYFQKVV